MIMLHWSQWLVIYLNAWLVIVAIALARHDKH